MTWVKIEQISKSFAGRQILREMSLTLQSGEVTALLGRSGTGKSTAASIVAGLIESDGGSVHATSVSGNRWVPQVSLMPQDQSVWATLTAMEQLELVSKSKRARQKSRDELVKLAANLGLQDRLLAPLHELSGGELKRLSFLRATIVSCDLLILDEPFASVDIETEALMQVSLRKYIDEESCSVLLITHSFDHALLLASQAAVLDRGAIVQCGAPAQLIEAPTHSIVAKLTGSHNSWSLRTLSDGNWLPIDQHDGGSKSGPAPATAYAVPINRTALGPGEPGLSGIVVSATPDRNSLKITLRNRAGTSSIDLSLPRTPAVLQAAKPGNPLHLNWLKSDVRLLPDS